MFIQKVVPVVLALVAGSTSLERGGDAQATPVRVCDDLGFCAERSAFSASSGARTPLAAQVRQLNEAEFELDRGTLEEILAQPSLLASTRIVPEARNGKVVGVRVYGVRPGGVLSAIGLQNGDRLDSLNGYSLGAPEQALEAYARLRRSVRFDLRGERRGQPLALSIHVR